MTSTAAAFIALGSNLGDRAANIRAALALLDSTPGVRVLAVSERHAFDAVTMPPDPTSALATPSRTRSSAPPSQGAYLNAAAQLATLLDPQRLLAEMLRIERSLGRVRPAGGQWGPRTIDLDLIQFVDPKGEPVRVAVVAAGVRGLPAFCVPHPRWRDRDFVVVPLAELGVHPG